MKSSSHTPPKWIRKFLGLFLSPQLLEASLGDLEEKFQKYLRNNVSPWKASMLYALEAVGFIKMASHWKGVSIQTTLNMLRHTLLFLTRLINKDKSYYIASFLGLTLSLSSFLFISMFVQDELAYDQFHLKKDNIYRLTTHLKLNDVDYNLATSQFPAAEAIRSELPEVEQTVRVFVQDVILESGDNKFEEHTILVDENFFQVFSFPLIYGDVKTALSEPSSIALTQAAAKKHFNLENPIGKILTLNGQTLTVTGIVGDVPEQSHIKFDAIVPLSFQLNIWKNETGLEGRENKWFWIGAYTYLTLRDNVDALNVQAKLPVIISKYFPERYKQNGKFELQPLTDIHLKSNLSSELEPGGSILYVRLFSIVAILIVVVSAINLINLSWFKISGRMREVGIRKFLGQNSAAVVTQLSIESILIGVIAFSGAVMVCVFFLSNFNLLVQKNLSMWSNPNLFLLGLTFLMIAGICLFAVLRPAIHFASRSSMHLLVQKYSSPGTARVRNVLVGLQVGFSFVLLAFSLIISHQIDFFRNQDLGFDQTNTIVVELNEDTYSHFETFKNELKKSKHVVEVAGGAAPGNELNGWRFVPQGGSYEKPFLFPLVWCDYNYISTLKIKLLAGESFDENKTQDSLWSFVINKRAAIELGWQDDPLNKTIEVFAPGTTNIMAKGKVIGVIDDYHYGSLHNAVKPIVLTATKELGSAIIRISPNANEKAIADINSVWKSLSGKPFTYEFLDKKLEGLYSNEAKLSSIMQFFTVITLFLTCYGMFAMSSLLFSSRLKEVSIRKVFGAGHFNIIKQFYSRYAIFNLAAIAIGTPVAVYIGNLWLQTFHYRIEMKPWFLMEAASFILLAGLLSMSYYLMKVAFSNPIKFLRRE